MAEGNSAFTLRNDISELETLRLELERFGESARLPMKALFEVNLALDELVTNIVSYGLSPGAEHEIFLDLAYHDGLLVVRLEDDGIPFNPLEVPPPDLEAPLECRRIGGLGIHLVRKVMDEIIYERNGGRNILTLKKRVVQG